MPSTDVERGDLEYKDYGTEHENDALLPNHSKPREGDEQARGSSSTKESFGSRPHFTILHLSIAFLAGTLACFFAQYAICGTNCFSDSEPQPSYSNSDVNVLAPPWAGSTQVDHFPPASPTNAFPSLFPTDVGYPGGTPTGAEAGIIATAPSYPLHTGAAHLVAPASLGNTKGKGKKFEIFKSWGNLSPWYSVDRTAFGLDSGPETPETCRVTGLHFLHRHGARYPTAWGESSTSNHNDIVLN